MAINALFLATVVESQVDKADTDPIDQSGNGDKVLEPSEDRAGRI